MSKESIELVQRLYAIGDLLDASPEQFDRAFREDLDEDFEFHLPGDYPEGEPVFCGREGVDRLVDMLAESWQEWHFEPERFIDAGDRVVVFARLIGRGGASGAPFDLETTHVWTIRGDRAVSMQAYRERAVALEAAGLSAGGAG
jgi:ketosteroid isomerase-like protein